MEEILDVLTEIKYLLDQINYNIMDLKNEVEEVKGYELYNSISDISMKIDDVAFDVCGKIDNITSSGMYTFQDVCSKLDSIDLNTF